VVRASASEPGGGDPRVRASASEPAGGDPRVRVTCRECREAVSARSDGEAPGITVEALDGHLATCRPCRRFAARVRVLGQALPVVDDPVPDRTAQVMAAVRRERAAAPAKVRRPVAVAAGAGRAGAHRRVARAGLALIAVVQVVAALVGVSVESVPHSVREVGAFQIALAVGFLVTAARPATAAGLLPTAAALALCLVGVMIVDIATGQTGVPHELVHATELAGVALVWLIARDHPARREGVERRPASGPGISGVA
jgi:predicted anti-sigma-YlaC factor YlaD